MWDSDSLPGGVHHEKACQVAEDERRDGAGNPVAPVVANQDGKCALIGLEVAEGKEDEDNYGSSDNRDRYELWSRLQNQTKVSVRTLE